MAIPLPVIGAGLTLAGGLLGRKERPTIDPEMLRTLFGPGALAKDTSEIYRLLLNSPAFASIMRSSGLSGAQLGNRINANIAGSGAGGSPIAAFAASAGRGYGGVLQNQGMAQLFLKALMAAQGGLEQRASIWGQSQLNRERMPTFERMLGSSLLAGGASAFDKWFEGMGTKTTDKPVE